MKKITLFAIEGCISSSIPNRIDAFAVADLWNPALSGEETNLFETKVITPAGKPITCSSCIQIHPHLAFIDASNSQGNTEKSSGFLPIYRG